MFSYLIQIEKIVFEQTVASLPQEVNIPYQDNVPCISQKPCGQMWLGPFPRQNGKQGDHRQACINFSLPLTEHVI